MHYGLNEKALRSPTRKLAMAFFLGMFIGVLIGYKIGGDDFFITVNDVLPEEPAATSP